MRTYIVLLCLGNCLSFTLNTALANQATFMTRVSNTGSIGTLAISGAGAAMHEYSATTVTFYSSPDCSSQTYYPVDALAGDPKPYMHANTNYQISSATIAKLSQNTGLKDLSSVKSIGVMPTDFIDGNSIFQSETLACFNVSCTATHCSGTDTKIEALQS